MLGFRNSGNGIEWGSCEDLWMVRSKDDAGYPAFWIPTDLLWGGNGAMSSKVRHWSLPPPEWWKLPTLVTSKDFPKFELLEIQPLPTNTPPAFQATYWFPYPTKAVVSRNVYRVLWFKQTLGPIDINRNQSISVPSFLPFLPRFSSPRYTTLEDWQRI